MPDIDSLSLAIIFAALALGSLTKGLTGFGLPIVSVPILAGFIGLDRTLAIMVLPSIASNFWLMWVHRAEFPSARRYVPLLLASFPGVALGGYLLTHVSERWLLGALAGWIVVYLIRALRARHTPKGRQPTLWRVAGTGFIAGTSQGATGITTPIVGTYLDALALSPSGYVFAGAVIYQVFWFSTGASLSAFGLFSAARAAESAFALLPVIVFVPLGAWLTGRISPARFTGIVRILLALIAIRLVFIAVTG